MSRRYQALERTAMDWHKARILEGYLTALEAQAVNEANERKRAALLEKIAWAKEKLAWLDPLIAHTDPILGQRQRQLSEDQKVEIELPRSSTWYGAMDRHFDDEEIRVDIGEDGLPW